MRMFIVVLSIALVLVCAACSVPVTLQEDVAAPSESEYTPTVPTPAPSATEEATPNPAPEIVDSSQYPYGSIESRIGPSAGERYYEPNVQDAIDDEVNDDSLFHVIIFVGDSGHDSGEYVYNGRTMSQWRVLVDLADGSYPYGEYNGDHGGDITKDEWRRRQEEAKTLNAMENLTAAIAEYRALGINEAMHKSEYDRLTALGFDMEQPEEGVLIGLLSRTQLVDFPVHESYGYAFAWASFYFDEVRE